MRVTVPDVFTFLRILCALVLLFLTPLSIPFLAVYALSGLSDLLDGFLARKLNQTSTMGAKLDSIADLFLYITVLVRLIPALKARLPGWFWFIVAFALLLRFCCYVYAALKFRRFASEHTYLNKATSFLVFTVPFLLKLPGFVWFAALICLVAILASLQELSIHVRKPLPEGEEKAE